MYYGATVVCFAALVFVCSNIITHVELYTCFSSESEIIPRLIQGCTCALPGLARARVISPPKDLNSRRMHDPPALH